MRDGDATLVEVFLEIRFGPRGVQPVAGIMIVFASLLCDGFVVVTDSG